MSTQERTGSRSDLHPRLTGEERERLLARGVELFNRGEHFACHEAWEEIWRSTSPEPRQLFQGLIQVAVGLHHFHQRRRGDVARRLLARGRRRLEPFAPRSAGLDLDGLLAGVRAWEAWLEVGRGEPPPVPRLRRVGVGGVR